MLAFIGIFISGICGYAGASLWSPLLAAAALVLISYSANHNLIRDGIDKGLSELVEGTLLMSAANALTAAGGCYAFGLTVRVLAWPA
jgi:hypothetical protein